VGSLYPDQTGTGCGGKILDDILKGLCKEDLMPEAEPAAF